VTPPARSQRPRTSPASPGAAEIRGHDLDSVCGEANVIFLFLRRSCELNLDPGWADERRSRVSRQYVELVPEARSGDGDRQATAARGERLSHLL